VKARLVFHVTQARSLQRGLMLAKIVWRGRGVAQDRLLACCVSQVVIRRPLKVRALFAIPESTAIWAMPFALFVALERTVEWPHRLVRFVRLVHTVLAVRRVALFVARELA
jgi:hypothetical protein